MRVVRPLALSLACLLSAAAVAHAEDAGGASAALDRAAKVRSKVPEPLLPTEEKPGPDLSFGYDGDLVASGENSGFVRIRVEVGEWREKPVWLVTEETTDEFGGSKTTTESTLYLARDLSLLKGEWTRTTSDRVVHLAFRRDGAEFEVAREITIGATTPNMSKMRIAAPEGAVFGRGAQLLFLRYAPADAATYALPVLALDAAIPAVDEHQAPPATDPLRVEVVGAAKYGAGKAVRDAFLARTKQGMRAQELFLDPKTRGLLGIDFTMPPNIRIVPKGEGGKRAEYEDDKPALTWKAAFMKFGHGYHLAVPKWVDASIHWETMLAHELSTGGVAAGTPLADFRKAYIDEFMRMSKHRPREQADGLLKMTLATAEEPETTKDGTVILRTSPEFGGNVYHFREIEKVWYLVRIDQ